MKLVAIVYDSFPHYRAGIIGSLNESKIFKYSFYGSNISRDPSIKNFNFSSEYDFNNIPFHEIGPFAFQENLFDELRSSNADCFILLGNPYFISSWFVAFYLRFTGRPVYFWTHGWLSNKENWLKRIFRNIFFSLADGLFLYGNRAKEIGVSQGFNPKKLHVINNSLDFLFQSEIFNRIQKTDIKQYKAEFGFSQEKKILICSARLTKKCRFDILLNAVSLLQHVTPNSIQIVLIGEGPELKFLHELSETLGLDVIFWGACYDEEKLCKLYYVSDLTVSPGKVGLTAIHSMTYGTPVLTHNNFDNQMPEYEAIIPGVTGDFFEEGSVNDLARVIELWFSKYSVKPVQNCVNRISNYYTPDYQRSIIENAIAAELSL
jgi:glycosyltransferase involved in cell wall biosynthesis